MRLRLHAHRGKVDVSNFPHAGRSSHFGSHRNCRRVNLPQATADKKPRRSGAKWFAKRVTLTALIVAQATEEREGKFVKLVPNRERCGTSRARHHNSVTRPSLYSTTWSPSFGIRSGSIIEAALNGLAVNFGKMRVPQCRNMSSRAVHRRSANRPRFGWHNRMIPFGACYRHRSRARSLRDASVPDAKIFLSISCSGVVLPYRSRYIWTLAAR